MRVLVWHVHGGWMNGFLRGDHDYVIPVETLEAAPPLPKSARAVTLSELRPAPAGAEPRERRGVGDEGVSAESIDIVVLQRLEEIAWVTHLLGRTPGRDVPAVFVEHNTPKQRPVDERHALADQTRIPIIHVTHFNRLMWDCGEAPVRVVEHGVPDPGLRYSGEVPALGVVVNEPVRRWRVTGTDLLPGFADTARIDVFGIDSDRLPAALHLPADRLRVMGDLPTAALHAQLARRRAYLHPLRWTSLGLSLIEAMLIGMPVLALATTEATRAVPPEAGAISADPAELRTAAVRLLADPEDARNRGTIAREFALRRYGLARFLADWDDILREWASGSGEAAPPAPLSRPVLASRTHSAETAACAETPTSGPGKSAQRGSTQ